MLVVLSCALYFSRLDLDILVAQSPKCLRPKRITKPVLSRVLVAKRHYKHHTGHIDGVYLWVVSTLGMTPVDCKVRWKTVYSRTVILEHLKTSELP